RDKRYNLVPIASLQNAVKTIVESRSDDDLEISRKLIAEKKGLLRKKQLEFYKEKKDYIKFFENNLSGSFDKITIPIINAKIFKT
ncbi:MAG: hypothetical protein ACKO6C_05640, partial [Alphaproteobacteria bacterium]